MATFREARGMSGAGKNSAMFAPDGQSGENGAWVVQGGGDKRDAVVA